MTKTLSRNGGWARKGPRVLATHNSNATDTLVENLEMQRRGSSFPIQDLGKTDFIYTILMLFTLLSVLILITYDAAASSQNRAGIADKVLAGADGSSVRQIQFILTAVLTVVMAFRLNGIRFIRAISIPYQAACFWAIISFSWALVPAISIRRSIGMYVILVSVTTSVYQIGPRRSIDLLKYLFITLIITSYISVMLSKLPLFSFAVHPLDELDTKLIGNWRGPFLHKNVAGAIMVHATIFLTFFGFFKRRFSDILFGLLAAVFVLKTHSETSTVWLPVILISTACYAFITSRRGRFRPIATTLILFGVPCTALLAYLEFNIQIDRFFSNPASLSRRVDVWQSILPFIETHFWLGSGYGSFWAIGEISPIFKLAKSYFVVGVGHSHSGYFEVLLTTGVIGLALAMAALVVLPFRRFLSIERTDRMTLTPLFGMWLFGILQNLTESQFFSPDKQSWILVVVAITIVHCRHQYRNEGGRWGAESLDAEVIKRSPKRPAYLRRARCSPLAHNQSEDLSSGIH